MRILSSIQPTGQFHLGNYLGALKHWVRLQKDEANECFYSIVDLHALTVVHDADTLKKNVKEAQIAMLALGFNPGKSTLFIQSKIHQHTELAWILATLTPLGDLERMTQFKDKSKQVGRAVINAGLLTYPILMAADIILYSPNYVPVGEDQIQHLELTRNLVERFNKNYPLTNSGQAEEIFTLPKAVTKKETARVTSLQDPTKKMSKSLGPQHYVGLFEDEKSIRDKIKRAVTDSSGEIKYDPKNKPAVSNLLAIFSGVTDKPIKDIEKSFRGKGYADFKARLADAVVDHLRPMRERYEYLSENPAEAEHAFGSGSERAKLEAEKIMQKVRKAVGLK